MSNKNKKLGLGIAAVAVAGAGLVYAAQKTSQQKVKKIAKAAPPVDYRNTERGKYEKNSKGIYYTNGNYEAFARPKKPEGVDDKNAYIVGSGLAALATACFLVRDGQMPGSHIHILEAMDVAGGACDGIFDPTRGYVMRGGREMENHFECLWDLFRSIPSLEVEGASVLDEYYWLNKHDPNYSLCRATEHRGPDAHTDGKFGLSQKGCMEIMKLFLTKDEDLYDKTIEDFFDEEVFDSNFWLYWRTMFAFENWHSALEMKLYIQRFIHQIGGLPDFSALKFTKDNQYESLILPMQKYLEKAGVQIQFNTQVTNVLFDIDDGKKRAASIECLVANQIQAKDITVVVMESIVGERREEQNIRIWLIRYFSELNINILIDTITPENWLFRREVKTFGQSNLTLEVGQSNSISERHSYQTFTKRTNLHIRLVSISIAYIWKNRNIHWFTNTILILIDDYRLGLEYGSVAGYYSIYGKGILLFS